MTSDAGTDPPAPLASRASPTSTPVAHVVAVHGNGGGAERFARAAPRMPDDVALHPITLPGFGDRPADPAVVTLRDHAEALAALAEDAPRPRVLLGHGIGGSLILELLQVRPAVADAVILHAPVGADLDERRVPRALRRRPWLAEVLRRAIATRALRPLLARAALTAEIPAADRDALFEGYRRAASFALMWQLIGPEWFAALAPTSLPSALLWGERERVLDVRQVRAFTRLLPDAVVRTVPGWDHFPMLDQPDAWAAEVADLARVLVGAPRGEGEPQPPDLPAATSDGAGER